MVTLALAPRPMVWARATRAPVDLAGAGVAAELAHQLDHLAQGRGAERLALRQQPARAVHRRRRRPPSASIERCSPGPQSPSSVHVSSSRAASVSWHSTTSRSSGPRPAGLVRVLRRERRRRRDVGVVDQPGHRGRLVEHVAGQVAAQRDRAEPHAADPLGPAQHDRGRALVRRAQHPEVERLADDPGGEHLLRR